MTRSRRGRDILSVRDVDMKQLILQRTERNNEMLKEKIRNISVPDIFLITSLFISFLFLIGNAFNHGQYFQELVMDSTFLFSDFFYHIAGSSDTSIMYSYGDPYSFPPFCYLMYTVLWSLNPYKDSESILNWQNYRQYDNMLVVLVMYQIICIILLLYCLKSYFQKNGFKYDVLLPLPWSYPIRSCALPFNGGMSVFWWRSCLLWHGYGWMTPINGKGKLL